MANKKTVQLANRAKNQDRLSVVSHKAKLTPEDVREIRRRYAKGNTQASLAKEFNSSVTAISLLLAGKIYRRVA